MPVISGSRQSTEDQHLLELALECGQGWGARQDTQLPTRERFSRDLAACESLLDALPDVTREAPPLPLQHEFDAPSNSYLVSGARLLNPAARVSGGTARTWQPSVGHAGAPTCKAAASRAFDLEQPVRTFRRTHPLNLFIPSPGGQCPDAPSPIDDISHVSCGGALSRYVPGMIVSAGVLALFIGTVAAANGQEWCIPTLVGGIALLFLAAILKSIRPRHRRQQGQTPEISCPTPDSGRRLQQALASGSPATAPVAPPQLVRTPKPEVATPTGDSPLPTPAAPRTPPRVSPSVNPSTAVPQIITRTSANASGAPLLDPYRLSERVWSADEDAQLTESYRRHRKMAAVAEELRVDQRQVAIRLTRLLFEQEGDIDDETKAPMHGRRWSKDEQHAVFRAYGAGESLTRVASSVGRTPLAVGWRLLESLSGPVPTPAAVARRAGLPF